MLDLLVGVPEVEVEQVEYLGLVHLAPTDLIVLQLVPGDEECYNSPHSTLPFT